MNETNLVGNVKEKKKNYDIMSVVMVYLGKAGIEQESNLLNLLNHTLSDEVKAQDKLRILEEKHGIKKTKIIESEVRHMCNLSEGILEKGLARGIEQGIEQGGYKKAIEMAKKLLIKGMSLAEISELTEIPAKQLSSQISLD